jgi:hypothetical protein
MYVNEKPFDKMIHGNKSIDLPLCIKDLDAPMSIVKKLKMNFKGKKIIKHLVYFKIFW